MADNGHWFKLWTNSLTDESLASIPNELWAMWAKLGAYIKCHGKEGQILIIKPAKMLCTILQCDDFECLINAIKCFPNVTVTDVTVLSVTFNVRYENWYKYQGDWSRDRVRKFRAKKAKNETVKKRREEKRIFSSNEENIKEIYKEKIPSKKREGEEPKKERFLRHVFLFPHEHESLLEKVGNRDDYFERLDNYIAQIGVVKASKKYVSHYDVILNWHRKDIKEGSAHGRNRGNSSEDTGEGAAPRGKYAGLGTVVEV